MKNLIVLILICSSLLIAQNAAVSSYLNPQTSGEADVRIREVRIPSSGYAICTYWCTLGYWTNGNSHGYGGLQWTTDNNQGPKNHIYSQWNDYTVASYHDSGTQVKTFGGEGTGVKSINNDPEHPWDPDFWHVTADRVWSEGDNTEFAFIAKDGKTDIWRHIITWSTPEADLKITGSYCFLEDWRGDGEYRESHLRKGWNRSASENWVPLTTYKYNINDNDILPGGRSYNKRTNWCGGIKSDNEGEFFYMGAGGSSVCTNNDNTSYTIARSETSPQEEYGVHRISNMAVIPDYDNDRIIVNWSWDSTTVPQWSYFIELKEGQNTLFTVQDTLPEKRSDTIDISLLTPDTKIYAVELKIIDFFDGESDIVIKEFGMMTSIQNSAGLNSDNLISAVQIGDNIDIYNPNFEESWKLKFYTVNGKEIFCRENIKLNRINLNVSKTGLAKGLYLCEIGKVKNKITIR